MWISLACGRFGATPASQAGSAAPYDQNQQRRQTPRQRIAGFGASSLFFEGKQSRGIAQDWEGVRGRVGPRPVLNRHGSTFHASMAMEQRPAGCTFCRVRSSPGDLHGPGNHSVIVSSRNAVRELRSRTPLRALRYALSSGASTKVLASGTANSKAEGGCGTARLLRLLGIPGHPSYLWVRSILYNPDLYTQIVELC